MSEAPMNPSLKQTNPVAMSVADETAENTPEETQAQSPGTLRVEIPQTVIVPDASPNAKCIEGAAVSPMDSTAPGTRRPPLASLSFGRKTRQSPTRGQISPTSSVGAPSQRMRQRGSSHGRRLSEDRMVGFGGSTVVSASSADSVASELLNNNPLQSDPELKTALDNLQDVNSHRSLQTWKASFLDRFEEFLGDDGSTHAFNAYEDFREAMKRFVKYVHQVKAYVAKGDISADRTTVKGRRSLNELNKCLVSIIAKERDLIPSHSKAEQRLGYTKFHLGAVLVRDGFQEHAQLQVCSDTLKHLRDTSLTHIADRQQLEEMENFDKQMIQFQDIMHDLGLSEVMTKCHDYATPEDEFLFVDLKTGLVGAISVAACLDKAVVQKVSDQESETFKEAIQDKDERQELIDLAVEAMEKERP